MEIGPAGALEARRQVALWRREDGLRKERIVRRPPRAELAPANKPRARTLQLRARAARL